LYPRINQIAQCERTTLVDCHVATSSSRYQSFLDEIMNMYIIIFKIEMHPKFR